MDRPFPPPDFEVVARKNRVVHSICVEAAAADGSAETIWLLDQCRRSLTVTRLVVWAPLEQPDLREYLDRILELDEDQNIVGVCRSFEFEPADFPSREETVAGAQTLAEYGLSFDLVLYHDSLPAVLELVGACPRTRFILDHLGKPDIRRKLEHPWKEQLAALAEFPNILCKVSGLTTEADHAHWKKEELKPYIDHVLRCFGWDRVMFGSDWPVCNLAGGYQAWLQALHWAISDVSEENKHKLFCENARRAFRLGSL